MRKSLLNYLLLIGLLCVPTQVHAQVYRYNPQTGGSENISKPAQTPVLSKAPSSPQRPGINKAPLPDMNKVGKAIAEEKKDEIRSLDGVSTNDLIGAVNKSIAAEQRNSERKMLPLGRVGIIIIPKDYNATIERNIAALNAIPDLDKLYMTPPMDAGQLLYMLKWKELKGLEFMADSRNLVQKKFNIKIPGFAYLRPDGTHTAYSLDDLAPFYEALTVQRRKVGK